MFCIQTWIIIVISFISVLFDIELVGFQPLLFFTDILVSIFLIALVQWFCSKNATVISWLTTIFLTSLLFFAIYMWRTKNPDFVDMVNKIKAEKEAKKN